MFTRILAATILLAGLTQGALAEGATPSAQPPPSSASSTQNTQTLPQELTQKLTSAGFTDVQIVPSSFLVSAKNKDGNQVMIRLSPDSMTMLTEMPVSNNSTTGSSTPSSTSSGNSSGATPGTP